jgi:hypothetical protein
MGDTTSGILPQYFSNRIPSFDLRGEAPVPGRERFRLQNSFATETLLRARVREGVRLVFAFTSFHET